MTVKEQHFQCGWSDRHIISVDKYQEGKGLDLKYFFEIRELGDVPTAREVEKARLEAFRVEDNCERVVISYLDADVVPENSRNAPLDGRLDGCPKKKVNLDGDQFYDWKPLTQKDEYGYRKKVKTFASTFADRQSKRKR